VTACAGRFAACIAACLLLAACTGVPRAGHHSFSADPRASCAAANSGAAAVRDDTRRSLHRIHRHFNRGHAHGGDARHRDRARRR
jgi:hypothetical protein